MTAFDPSYGEQPEVVQKTSGLAISSLVCSLICCLPITTILGILLGIGAMVSIGGNPAKKGKVLAITGIVLGILFTAGQGIIYPPVFKYFQSTIDLVNRGPEDALTAGFANDYDGMRAAFHGNGSSATDEQTRAFIDQLQSRYGGFVNSHLDDQNMQSQPAFGQPTVVFPYQLTFENSVVEGEAEIVFSDPQRGGFISKLGFIKIIDPELGDLTFPDDSLLNNEAESEGDAPGESDASDESKSGDSDTSVESDSGG